MSREIVFVAGSPSPTSRSSLVARGVADHAERSGYRIRSFSLGDFDPADVLYARADAPAARVFVESVKGAAALVLSTPVYKGAYAGGLKAIVDLIPVDALVGRPALGVATTRLEAHAPEVDRAYRALFAFFLARPLDPLVVLDEEFEGMGEGRTLGARAAGRVEAAARALIGQASGS
jgi:FMN reductase